jgi:hypothetical protein
MDMEKYLKDMYKSKREIFLLTASLFTLFLMICESAWAAELDGTWTRLFKRRQVTRQVPHHWELALRHQGSSERAGFHARPPDCGIGV